MRKTKWSWVIMAGCVVACREESKPQEPVPAHAKPRQKESLVSPSPSVPVGTKKPPPLAAQPKTPLPAEPNTVTSSPSIETVATPPGYSIAAEAMGDLDRDAVNEKVIVFNLPGDPASARRELRIYKQDGGRWRLWHKSTRAVLSADSGGVMGDPLDGIEIVRGCIVIRHYGGSRERWSYTHRYRYQNNAWELIGATATDGAPCGEQQELDYNLATGRGVYRKTLEVCGDAGKPRGSTVPVIKIKKSISPLPRIESFTPGDLKIPIPNSGREMVL